jgi:hypothetical protein
MSKRVLFEEFEAQTWKQRVGLIREQHTKEKENLCSSDLQDERSSYVYIEALWRRLDDVSWWSAKNSNYFEKVWEEANDRLSEWSLSPVVCDS